MPGISAITITAGPLPETWTVRVVPSSDTDRAWKSSSGSSGVCMQGPRIGQGRWPVHYSLDSARGVVSNATSSERKRT